MKKPADLRATLTQWVPDLARNPDKLHVFIEKGRTHIKAGSSLSWQYHYTLQILVTDFTESVDVLMVPIMVWLQTNQPDLLLNTEQRERAVSFEAEIIDHDKIDIALSLELSERIVVSAVLGGFDCAHVAEPQLPDLSGPFNWQIYLKGEPLTP